MFLKHHKIIQGVCSMNKQYIESYKNLGLNIAFIGKSVG